ncbi:hypothetical protein R3P38DRAFT_2967763, partial [Favolaschia claudopus]
MESLPVPRCRKGCTEPRLTIGQPLQAVKYGPHCQCSRTHPYIARAPRICRRHNTILYHPPCNCNEKNQRSNGSQVNCRQGCLDPQGLPAKKPSSHCRCWSKQPTERRCASGCLDSAGQRAIKYKEHCACVDPRKNAGYRLSACKCETLICSHRSQLPTVDGRAKNSQAKRLARGLDRKPQLPLSSLSSVPREEYFQSPIGVRKSREKDEKRARDRAYAIRCEMDRKILLDYVELKYLSAETQAREPTYHGGPTRVSPKLWCCPVRKFESRPWNPAPTCGYIIDLAKLYSKIPLQGSVALMETECRKIFNETICLHIREHMKGFGLDFDSN